jgi:hypothetical protein
MKRIFIQLIISVLVILNTTKVQSQTRFPIWTFHEKDVNIYGLSFGAFSTINNELNTNTYGVRLEVPGLGFLFTLFPSDMNLKPDFTSERIYGINFSLTGSFGCNTVYGINLNGISGYTIKTTGLSISLFSNLSYEIYGIQISGIASESNSLNGVQIGLIGNTSKRMNGLQIGLGNTSQITNGLQIGLSNYGGKMRGLQIGLYNYSETSTFQIGLWNINGNRHFPFFNF